MLSSCDPKPELNDKSNKKRSKDCLPDSLSALVKGKQLLIEKYGYIDSINHVFNAILSEDSIWHVIVQPNVFENEQMKDTIPMNRGSETVLMNKHNCKIIGFFIAR